MASQTQKSKRGSMSRSNSGGFFACFRPTVADRDDNLIRSRSNPMKGGVDERGDNARIAFNDGKETDALLGIATCPRGCKGEVDDRSSKGGARKRFTRATKAVFLEMSLVRKVQKKKKPKITEEPNGDLSKRADRILRLMSNGSTDGKNDSCEESTRSDYDISVSSHSPAAVVSLSRAGSSSNSLDAGAAKLLLSGSISSEPKRFALDRPSASLADAPVYLILLTLAVLVFWGKLCAIVFTSTCLVVALPTRTPRRGSDDEESVDSAEYKKRIIMEGLLQRQRPGAPLRLRSS